MTVRGIDRYWAACFGLAPEEMHEAGVRVLPHRALEGYHGAWVFRHEALTIISAPEALCLSLEARARGLNGDPLSEAWIRSAFDGVGRIIGPAYDGYTDASRFRPVSGWGVRRLSDEHREGLRGLARACEGVEWEESGLEMDGLAGHGGRVTFGRFVGRALVAAAQCWTDARQGNRAGLITHPAHRGQGFGKAVRSAAVEHALQEGGIPLYQTRLSNRSAIAVAEALGFRQYATHLAARFR